MSVVCEFAGSSGHIFIKKVSLTSPFLDLPKRLYEIALVFIKVDPADPKLTCARHKPANSS